MSVCTGIRAPVIRVPSPSRLAPKEQFDGTVYGTVTPRIQPSSDGRIRPYDGREWSRDDSARHLSVLSSTRTRLAPHCASIFTTEDSQIAQGRRPMPQACVTSERPLRALHSPCVAQAHKSLARPLTGLTSQA